MLTGAEAEVPRTSKTRPARVRRLSLFSHSTPVTNNAEMYLSVINMGTLIQRKSKLNVKLKK